MLSVTRLNISILLLVFCVGFFFYYRHTVNTAIESDNQMIAVTLKKGQGVSSIAEDLKSKGLIRSPLIFKLYVFFHGLSNSLQAGDYELSAQMNLKELVTELQHGTFDIKLTFLEGWRTEEMADYLSAQEGLSFKGADFLKSAEGKEGKLFPDTYVVPRYITAPDLIGLMVSNYNAQMVKLTELIKSSQLNVEELTILASIVEREAKDLEDRKIVAGILRKRLENDWPLQADATLQYVLGYQTITDAQSGDIKGSWWKQSLTGSDLELDSPYNTRKNGGLPPGPICNPSLGALEAVLSPQDTEFWYYLSDSQGNMHYAIKMEEHADNISTYLH